MLTETEVKKIAKLARIEVSDNEIEKLKGELSSILDFVKKLGEADTNNIEPIYQTTGLVNSFRSDESRGEFKMDESLNERLVGQAPHKENRFVKIKSVFERK